MPNDYVGMERSQTIENLATAFSAFQGEVGSISKDGSNPYFKSKYATLENIVKTIKPALFKNGLSFSQFPVGENYLTTLLMHKSGEFVSSVVKMTPKDNSPQAQGSAITYMRRYALSAILGLVTDEDDDGSDAQNGTSAPPAKKLAPRAAARPKVALTEHEKKVMEGLGDLPPELETVVVPDGDPRPTPYECSNCGESVTEKVASYSKSKYGRTLCMNCQKTIN